MSGPSDVVRQFLRVQFNLARRPLQLIESQVVVRYLPADTSARRSYERMLGALDGFAGRSLGDGAALDRSRALEARDQAVVAAEKLEAQATRLGEQAQGKADDEVAATRRRSEATRTTARKVTGTRAQATKDRQQASAQADRQAAAAKAAVDARATARRRNTEEARRSTQEGIAEREARATAPAKETLERAADTKKAATQQKADADRLGELSNAEKEQRRNST